MGNYAALPGCTKREKTQYLAPGHSFERLSLFPMRTVVDSNFLQSDGLRAYLSKSPANMAVLTDYAAMEAHKPDTLEMLYRSMAIVAEFPRQVIVLKGTQAVCAAAH